MSVLTLKAKRRDTGKKSARALRRDNAVPGVYYISGDEGLPISVDSLELRPVVYTSEMRIVSLEVDSDEARPCILKDVTFDPITDR